MGESAGGGHAAMLTIAARDRGEVPIAFQLLIYPMLDDATDDPADNDKLSILQFRAQKSIEVVFASAADLDTAIATHYPLIESAALDSEADRILGENHAKPAAPPAERLAQQKPIVRLVNNLLLNAVQRRASDLHLHSRERCAEVRYRIDGSLVAVGEFNRTLLPSIVARIKVLAAMDLAEHRVPQDGAIHLSTPQGFVDMRVSMMPAVHGENVVIRILDPKVGLRRLADVGFSATDERRFRALIDRNQGLVLVTGPTGSGKTTTLYAALQEMNTGEHHIVTVEDPVEYRLDGIVQIQVHPAIDFGFAQALRHILRHDPDVILIGEVRDADTAKIAVESALADDDLREHLQQVVERFGAGHQRQGVIGKRCCPPCSRLRACASTAAINSINQVSHVRRWPVRPGNLTVLGFSLWSRCQRPSWSADTWCLPAMMRSRSRRSLFGTRMLGVRLRAMRTLSGTRRSLPKKKRRTTAALLRHRQSISISQ